MEWCVAERKGKVPRITNEMIWDRLAIIESKLDQLLSQPEPQDQPEAPNLANAVDMDLESLEPIHIVPCREWIPAKSGRCGAKVRGTAKQLGARNNRCDEHLGKKKEAARIAEDEAGDSYA